MNVVYTYLFFYDIMCRHGRKECLVKVKSGHIYISVNNVDICIYNIMDMNKNSCFFDKITII